MPRRAGGQLALLLITVLLLAQVITIWILAGERQGAMRSANRAHVLERVIDAYALVDATEAPQQERVLRLLSSTSMQLTVGSEPQLSWDEASNLSQRIADELDLPQASVRSALELDRASCVLSNGSFHDEIDEHEDHDERAEHAEGRHHEEEEHRERLERHHDCPPTIALSLGLSSGQWLNAEARPSNPTWLWLQATLTSVAISAILLTLTLLLAIRRILRPVNELSDAAHAFARGEKVQVQARGPEDIREVIHAFNRMQVQVSRAQEDRERLLAALAHDLRTPITSMRLRVEMLPAGEDRDRLLDTLQDMQHLAEATLDFIRGSTAEQSRRYDLATLLDSLCSDLQELGMAVDCQDSPRCVLQGQPEAVKRALRNLIENAVHYGQRASVTLDAGENEAIITITDQGPGIPEQERDKVFQPFYRLEQSRSRETGGAGLGLAIARTLIRGMGGDIHLAAGPEGRGLVVEVSLPVTDN
ncbi:sensor histidine kinase [Marinobacter zhejiangensis]|nr:HAMP domain-containing sensor histidine kinase [Marinobacter zhejiangensis]